MIEIVTTNGFRRMVKASEIVSIGELRNNGRSNTVIVTKQGDTIFADDTYDNLKRLYEGVTKE